LNLYKNKNDYKVNKINKYFFNNNKYDDDNNNNYKLNKNFKYLSSINPFNTIRKEGPTGHADAIPESITDKLYNSIFQISLYNGMATGFFMRIKLNNIEKKYLLTCFHVISDQDIQNQKTIDIFFGKKGEESHREIELDKNMRFMKAYKEEDVTIIEVIDNDKILKGKYLTLDLNYEYGYERYLNENCYLAGYPENHSERCISSGRIIEIKNYKFYHELDTRPGSSGSPITNDKGDVIGIHTHGLDLLNKNKGTFIGKILDNLKDEYILININNYISGQSTSYNLYNHGNNNSNIKSNYDMIDTNNKIKTSFDNYENFIQGEIYIEENQINKEINIINSYENSKRKQRIYCFFGNKNEKELMENCVIKINDKEIPFSYHYTFGYSGKYKIEYSFKHYLKNTNYIFYECDSLTNLNLSNFNTTNVTDMSYMFRMCKSLRNLDLSNFNTTYVHNMSYMFGFCKSLTSLDLSNFNTTNVINMSNMFEYCDSLRNLDLSNFNTTNVHNMSGMFEYCESLTNINLSNFNTTNVYNMSSMFKYCKSLRNLDLSNFNTKYVINMNNMFEYCKSLRNLNLLNFNTTNATNTNGMFKYCESLKNINLSKYAKKHCINMLDRYEHK